MNLPVWMQNEGAWIAIGIGVLVLALGLLTRPERHELVNGLGELLIAAGRNEQAVLAYKRVLHFDPGHQEAITALLKVQPGFAHA